MTSTYRGAWDAVANPKSAKEFAVDSTVAVEIGDIMWWDKRASVARSAADSTTWTGTTDGSQGKVAENFIGFARSAFAVGDLHAMVRIEARGVYRVPVTTAATFEVGDLINASKNPAGSVLYAQQVDKGALNVGEPTARARELAIGRAAKRYVAATNIVEVEIMGSREAGSNFRQYLTS